MHNGNLLISSIALVAVAGLTIVTVAASYYPLFPAETTPTTPTSSTETTVTEQGTTTITSTQQLPVRQLPTNLTGTIYKTSASSQGLTFTMEYNGTRIRTGKEAIVFRLTLENVNNTSWSVGTSEGLGPFYVDIFNSSSSSSRLIDGFGDPTASDRLVALKPGDKVSRLAIWDNTQVVGIGSLIDNYPVRIPIVSPGTYQFTGRATVLDPADGHQLFTIQTQPVTIEVLPS